MTKRFADRDAPAMLRVLLLEAFSIKASHAVGPLEFFAGMDKLTRHVDVDESTTMDNDEVLMITGRKLLRSMDNATDDVEPLEAGLSSRDRALDPAPRDLAGFVQGGPRICARRPGDRS